MATTKIERTAGNVEAFKRSDGTIYYRARVTLADGSRVRLDVPKQWENDEFSARVYAEEAQLDEDASGDLLRAKMAKGRAPGSRKGETCSEYHARLLVQRAADGVRGTATEANVWRKWVAPTIGDKSIATVTRAEVEDVRDRLDRAVREYIAKGPGHGCAGRTAANAWSVLRVTFKEACAARDRALRVRDDDPSERIKPPLKTDSRRKTFLYSPEVLALLACEDVPLEWREVYAISVYTYLRPGELHVLRWSDVNLDGRVLHVTKAWDWIRREAKAPKTDAGFRDVPIHDELVPLLARMKKGKPSDALVVPVLSDANDDKFAGRFREHLRAAGCTRERLYEDTATTIPANFRSCRDTGITWLVLAGVDLAAVQRRAGHEQVSTTLGYVKAAEDLRGAFGQPFPALPPSLVRPSAGQAAGAGAEVVETIAEKSCRRRDLNRHESADSRGKTADSRPAPPTKTPQNAAESDTPWPSAGQVEDALAAALRDAAAAREWSVVAALAAELRARREAREADALTDAALLKAR